MSLRLSDGRQSGLLWLPSCGQAPAALPGLPSTYSPATPLCRIENINQAVHAAFEQEKADFELELTDAMSQTVADAVETAIFDRAFDFRANVSGCLAGRLAGCRGQGGRESLLPQLCYAWHAVASAPPACPCQRPPPACP